METHSRLFGVSHRDGGKKERIIRDENDLKFWTVREFKQSKIQIVGKKRRKARRELLRTMSSSFYFDNDRELSSRLVVLEPHDLQLRTGMLDAYVLVNVVGLLAPHAAIRTLKPRGAAALELAMAQHVMHVAVAPLTLGANVPDPISLQLAFVVGVKVKFTA
ncbi:hypothetical protein KM043_007656 [Ampulex compressa]|nr:hypothetical protein KM043_007656 [Ampulex compressa]